MVIPTDSRSPMTTLLRKIDKTFGIFVLVGTIRSKSEEFIVVCGYSLFLEFEFSRSALFLHFSFKNCVENKVKAFPGLFDWPMQSRETQVQ